MTTASRAIRLRGRSVPVVLPNVRDPRLHTAAVIVSIHVIGITALGFRVSVPQILVAIVTAGLIDVTLTLRATGKLVWPASGMLTGSGVALILRLVGMDSGDYWSWDGVHWFALVAAGSILTKYVVRYRGAHIFNPSNVGLVVAFLVIGSEVVEPLDFWWAPLRPPMILGYAVIIVGGVLITRRLRLLEMAAVFWVTLAGGLGILAASGHCMIATWSPTPVCGPQFWRVLVTSPEILIFLFFMITDPKTIPSGRTARVVFAATLGMFTTLMIAPHTVEYGAKVGLLGSLVVWSPLRGLFDRIFPETAAERSGLAQLAGRVRSWAPQATFLRGVAGGGLVGLVAVAIVVAGGPARTPAIASGPPASQPIPVSVDPTSVPEVTVLDSVRRLDMDVDDDFVDAVALTLLENLAIEAEAIRTANGGLLAMSSGGVRLDDLQARLDAAVATGERRAFEYDLDSLRLGFHEAPEGQISAGLLFEAEGTAHEVLYDTDGVEQSRTSERFAAGFVLRQLTGERWIIVGTEPVE